MTSVKSIGSNLLRVVLVILFFTIVNGIIVYIISWVRYSWASSSEKNALYVYPPDIVSDISFSSILVIMTYTLYSLLFALAKRIRYLNIASFLIYTASLMGLTSIAAGWEVFSFKIISGCILMGFPNFFMPSVDSFTRTKFLNLASKKNYYSSSKRQ